MYLITQTLLSKWNYIYDCAEGFEEDAYAELVSYLRKEPQESNEKIQNGINFEEGVYALMRGEPLPDNCSKWKSGCTAVATRLNGGQIQVAASRPCVVDGETYLVYGKCDVVRAGVIHDVKFSNKSFSQFAVGKYLDSAQHSAYFYIVPGAYKFEYDVSDGQDLYTETYLREETRPIESIIHEFVQYLESTGLIDLYHEYWKAR